MNEDGNKPIDDAAEWDQVVGDFSQDHGLKPDAGDGAKDNTQGGSDDAAKKAADEAAAKKAEEEARANETPEQKAEREKKEADEAAAKGDPAAQERARQIRDQRSSQREIIADETAMRDDIRTEMFPDTDGKLYDEDGDEIKTIEDVMRHTNNQTGKNFTKEEAGAWLLAASQHATLEKQKADARISEIADVNISIKDEADTVKERYGAFLADPKNAQLRDEILADYLETLEKDPDTGIIVRNPVSMVRFYDRALKPYVDGVAQATAADAKAAAETEKAKRLEQENKQLKTRTDREDIFSRGNNRDTLDEDDKEWADATKDYYKDRA